MVGGKKGNRTEPNRTTGLHRTEPTEISDTCGTGFYRRHPEPNYFYLSFQISLRIFRDVTYLSIIYYADDT